MEDEIKVGEFVRTKTGYIGKINKISTYKINNKDKTVYLTKFFNKTFPISYTDIKNHSFNIIDLIQVGDYVNGEKVLSVDWGGVGIANFKFIEPEDIKSIITKEQIKQIEFRIKE